MKQSLVSWRGTVNFCGLAAILFSVNLGCGGPNNTAKLPTSRSSSAEQKPSTAGQESRPVDKGRSRSAGETADHSGPTPHREPIAIANKEWPYEFIGSKTDGKNVMELYVYSEDFDAEKLKAFCQERKQQSPAKVFYYVVVFDKAASARFPSSPLTAEYGIDEDALRHIRAMYVFNRLNGFSELRRYARNAWESVATRESI
jgi:hypothetical protein